MAIEERYRDCFECGLRLNVTSARQGRALRCDRCGAVFRHDRDACVSADAEPGKPSAIVPRLALGAALVAGGLVGGWYALDRYAPVTELAIATACACVAFVVTVLVMRRASRDAAGTAGASMLMIGIGTLALVMLGGDVPEGREAGLTLIVMTCGALGGTQLVRWVRNQVALPSFNEQGMVIPEREKKGCSLDEDHDDGIER